MKLKRKPFLKVGKNVKVKKAVSKKKKQAASKKKTATKKKKKEETKEEGDELFLPGQKYPTPH